MTSQKPTALQSLAAGAAAGGVESFITVSDMPVLQIAVIRETRSAVHSSMVAY